MGVYSHTLASYLPRYSLIIIIPPLKCFNPTMTFVELLWTLKVHSLGQSEDQVKVISYLHFILFVDIRGGLPSYGSFLCKHSWVKQSSQGR
jgi:hypothetical protein